MLTSGEKAVYSLLFEVFGLMGFVYLFVIVNCLVASADHFDHNIINDKLQIAIVGKAVIAIFTNDNMIH